MASQRCVRSFVMAVGMAATLSAQTPNPTFDVTSVKRSNAEADTPSPFNFPPGRFVARNLPLRLVIAFLYLSDGARLADRISGGPSWLDTELYDIEGKVLEENPPQETLRLMARALLEDRFQLRIHSERIDGPVYELVMARPDGRLGDQLKSSIGTDCTTDAKASFVSKVPLCGLGFDPRSEELTLNGYNVTMDQVARHLRGFIDRPIINRTELAGRFSFELKVPREADLSADIDGAVASTPGGRSALLPTAVREQLGLRMANATGPVDVLVIESVQRPTEN